MDLEVSKQIAENPHIWPYLCGLIVKQEYQRLGIGTKLALAAIDKVKNMGYPTVYIGANIDDPYAKIYEKYGCIKIADTTFRTQPTSIYKYDI